MFVLRKINRERIRNALIIFQEWVFPWLNPDPYIPDGRDENERELQRSLHDSLKMLVNCHIQSSMILFSHFSWAYLPYEGEDLTILDWYCSIICHFYVFFLLSSFFVSYFNRRKALILHFISLNVMIALSPAYLFDYFWQYYTGESLKHPMAYKISENYHVFFWANFSYSFLYISMVSHTIYLYCNLRRYQKVLDERILALKLKQRRHLFGG